jgi:hypothetical protein
MELAQGHVLWLALVVVVLKRSVLAHNVFGWLEKCVI